MEGILFQDWTTIRGVRAAGDVYQSEDDWLDVDPYIDLVFWIQASQVLFGGGSGVVLDLETAPTKDEALFVTMGSVSLTAGTAPTISKVLDGFASVLPQAWLRWKLRPTGFPVTEWGATFRIYCAANPRRRL